MTGFDIFIRVFPQVAAVAIPLSWTGLYFQKRRDEQPKRPKNFLGRIPKKLHMIWVGDESKRPDDCIQTWRDNHPAWEFRLWGNAELDALPWRSKRQMDIFRAAGHWEGVGDLMRYEILCEHGGFYADADSISVKSLDEWLLATGLFVCWESERHRPGLVANTFIGSIPQHPALRRTVAAAARMNDPVWRRTWRVKQWRSFRPVFRYVHVPPWQSVGPVFFTKMVLPFSPAQVTILPSVLFLPKRFLDMEERSANVIYARHNWGGTHPACKAVPRS